MAIDPKELRSLVDWEHGIISPGIFIDGGVYRQELKMLFGRAWLFLAHDSMIPDPGDFLNTYMGGDPVIVARQRDGSVRAYLNAGRHRGRKVCRAEDGNARNFMCTYHGWTYDLGGNLVNVPNLDDAYHNELDKTRWGLVQVAQIDSYKGLWYATFDPTAPPLLDYLGDMTYYIATAVALGCLVAIEFRSRQPMLDLRLLQDRLFRYSSLATLFQTMTFLGGMLYITPLLLQQLDGRSPLAAGW
jgi:3-phenylpropionate/trans-cinnamate dioxygenase subunit alpha